MIKTNELYLIVDPHEHMQKTIFSNMCKHISSNDIYLSNSSLEALWTSIDIAPRFIILNFDTLHKTAAELIKRLQIILQDFHSIIIYSSNCTDYTNDIQQKFKEITKDTSITTVPYEDFITNTHVYFTETCLNK